MAEMSSQGQCKAGIAGLFAYRVSKTMNELGKASSIYRSREVHLLMPFDLQSVINSPVGVGLALGLGRILPASVGYQLADQLALLITAQKKSAIVRAVRANQWVVHGGEINSNQLEIAVQAVFRNTAFCLFDFYHHLNRNTDMERRIHFSPQSEALLENRDDGESGVVIVGVHLSNFDLVAFEAARRGLKAMVLAYTNPGKGYEWQNELRRRAGLELVPASAQAVRQAVRRLRQGGHVLTGIDRPIQDSKYQPIFFGKPANLPVHHIHLALAAQAKIVVVAAIKQSDNIYDIQVSDAIQMQLCSDRDEEILVNAERVLKVAEGMIRQAPEQWAMFFPVWPTVQNIG
jgi:lauroyl/myristoyl acyltransferase